ncbi:MAG: hypothetical protein M1814_001844 [Vezdaea aestivalis]|nr:MAG: hypothetical protein M1814_001844 [Vezdaea aestivalis]
MNHRIGPKDEKAPIGSDNASPESSAPPSQLSSRSHSRNRDGRRERFRVRFNSGGESLDVENQRARFDIKDEKEGTGSLTRTPTRLSPAHSRSNSVIGRTVRHFSHVPHPADIHQRLSEAVEQDSRPEVLKQRNYPQSRPSLPRHETFELVTNDGNTSEISDDDDVLDITFAKNKASLSAQRRAMQLSRSIGTHSAPSSLRTSPSLSAVDEPLLSRRSTRVTSGDKTETIKQMPPIPPLNTETPDQNDLPTDSDEEGPSSSGPIGHHLAEANRLVQMHTHKLPGGLFLDPQSGPQSGRASPENGETVDWTEDWKPVPGKYRGGVLSNLLKLYRHQNPLGKTRRQQSYSSVNETPLSELPQAFHRLPTAASDRTAVPPSEPPSPTSGQTTPITKWYKNQQAASSSSIGALIGSSTAPFGVVTGASGNNSPPTRPPITRSRGSGSIGTTFSTLKSKARSTSSGKDEEIRIRIHIARVVYRQQYIVKLCRALMTYGAPTHRLEDQLKSTARVLEIESQFLYMPGCMLISFDDSNTHTAEVKLVRAVQGVNLGKLEDVHTIYKEVVHDITPVDVATKRLEEVIARDTFHPGIKILTMGFASATVAPFAFGAGWYDLPICLLLGMLVGFLQFFVAPRLDLYANVFEVTAAIVTSFCARAFGSLAGGEIFCFSAIAQASIAMILPGYIVLAASLELQSRAIVAGSVRMVYAIIYSLFLGFGVTIGTVLYALADKSATSDTTCRQGIKGQYMPWLFVPPFTVCLMILNDAKLHQAIPMILVSFAGYITNWFTASKLPCNAQLSQTVGALVVGVLGNLYSRFFHGVAAATLLPAIFVQVPSGLAATGSLVSGVQSADRILGNSTKNMGNGNTTVTGTDPSAQLDTVVYNVGVSMVQVAIGITVGLFISAFIVYPCGKRRSGLFSF